MLMKAWFASTSTAPRIGSSADSASQKLTGSGQGIKDFVIRASGSKCLVMGVASSFSVGAVSCFPRFRPVSYRQAWVLGLWRV